MDPEAVLAVGGVRGGEDQVLRLDDAGDGPAAAGDRDQPLAHPGGGGGEGLGEGGGGGERRRSSHGRKRTSRRPPPHRPDGEARDLPIRAGPGQSVTRPIRAARTTASVRRSTPSFWRMEFTWNFAVWALMLERVGDVAVGEAAGEQRQHLALAGGEGLGAGRGTRLRSGPERGEPVLESRPGPGTTASSAARRVAPSALPEDRPGRPGGERGAGVLLSLYQREDRRRTRPERGRRRARGVPEPPRPPALPASTVTADARPGEQPGQPRPDQRVGGDEEHAPEREG